MMRCLVIVVALAALFWGQSTARDLTERQVNVDFKAEYYRISALMIQKQVEAFRCFARLFFQDSNPPPVLDPAAEATAAPVTTAAPPPDTTAVPPSPVARSVETRQQQPPGPSRLQRWQVDEINRLAEKYDRALSDLEYCEREINRRPPMS